MPDYLAAALQVENTPTHFRTSENGPPIVRWTIGHILDSEPSNTDWMNSQWNGPPFR